MSYRHTPFTDNISDRKVIGKIRQGAPRKGDQMGGGCRQKVGRYLSPGLSEEVMLEAKMEEEAQRAVIWGRAF